jgi:RNA polymerase sigma factor (sigma-70 family)
MTVGPTKYRVMDPASDRELLAAAGSDPRAFEAFYRRHVRGVVSFAARRCSTPEEAADLVAATFVEVIESAERYDPERGEPAAWLLGIAANVLAGRRRRDGRERAAIERLSGRRLLDGDDHSRLEDMIDAARVAPHVEDAISGLPGSQRAVVDLVREGLSPTDAARELRISSATARMRLSRARRSLRRSLAGRLDAAEHQPIPKEER